MARLTSGGLLSLLLATFAVGVGYSIVLPALPSLIEQSSNTTDVGRLAQHTGAITGTYIVAVFLSAPLWGRFSDRWGRRPVLIVGLAGFVASALLIPPGGNLLALYIGRFLDGLFAGAIAPAAYALVGDHAPSPEWRGFRFALINGAGTIGFFVGPILGGAALSGAGELPAEVADTISYVTAISAVAALIGVWGLLPQKLERPKTATEARKANAGSLLHRLWAVAFATAAAVGAFEVGLSLRGKLILDMDGYQIGMMFALCSLIMLAAQVALFSPWVKADSTRWLFLPGIVTLALGLIAVPFASSDVPSFLAVAFVAASAGVLSPLVTYWVSLGATRSAGADLGATTAAASLGQIVGSLIGGFLFTASGFPDGAFLAAAAIVLAALPASYGLPHRLAVAVAAMPGPK